MEIQGQMPIQATSGSAGSSAQATGVAANGANFSSALSTVMTTANPSAGQDQAPAAGVSALLQLLMPLLNMQQLPEEQAKEMTESQLDGLIKLLEQSDSDLTDDLLNDPGLQAWLAEVQSFFLTFQQAQVTLTELPEGETAMDGISDVSLTTDEPMEAVSPFLFVPLDHGKGTTDHLTETKSLTKSEAIQLLNDVKQLLHTASGLSNGDLKQVMKELPAVAFGLQQHEDAGLSQENSDELHSKNVIQVATSSIQKLEYLAAKTVTPKFAVDIPAEQHDQLFEPLETVTADTEMAEPIPMHEFLKHQQTAGATAKPAYVQMPAATFTDDMTRFVVSSFSIQTSSEGFTEAKLSLYPQHLGHVEVKLSMQHGQLTAHFIADNAAGKEMLENQMAQLRSSLQNQGIQIEKIEVSQSQSFQSGMFQEQRQQQPGQSGKQSKSGNKNLDTLEVEGTDGADFQKTRAALTGTGVIDYSA
ncbi:flagellar hook-length control protein FliK [Paenibacillus silviterrae]|uniref:flagellar hook-length control protein FliK n=1 Tax=Paenibacillus silviterrae TaxID=3242194 RepID=UPI002543EFB0|nr:flagellar hook-length control protein FliK [Paenibacillus chinjuensis]